MTGVFARVARERLCPDEICFAGGVGMRTRGVPSSARAENTIARARAQGDNMVRSQRVA